MQRYWLVLALLLATSLCQFQDFNGEQCESGFLHLGPSRNDGELYYMLFQSRDQNPTAPLVWFFEGGPGMTVMHAVFYQNGPFRLHKDLSVTKNEFSFNNIADVLYVDQPLGTGFSNVTNSSWIPHHESVIVADLLKFMDAFMERHPEYHHRPMYLVSQAYGSHFVLPLATAFSKSQSPLVNIQGLALGNPWIRPEIQLTSLSSFTKRMKLCTEFQYIASLYGYILSSIFIDLDLDMQAFELMEMATGVLIGIRNHKFNRYDTRIRCNGGNCTYNFTELTHYLEQPQVRRAMNTVDRVFHFNSMVVLKWLIEKNEYFSDKSDSLIHLLENTSLPIYIFSGMDDWWINTFGMDQFIASLHWTGRAHMETAAWRDWYSDGQWQGKYKHFRNFYYVHVKEAGHFVGMDLPSFALDLLTKLTYGSNY